MIFNDSKFNVEWDVYSLSDLGTFARGKSKHRPRNDPFLFDEGDIPFIQTADIKKSILHINTCDDYYNKHGLAQSKLWPKGTLCITIAANIADTAILSFPACFPDSVVGFNSNEKTNVYFMHYLFQYISSEIKRRASGSTQDNINLEYLSGLKFRIPNKSVQIKILNILQSIDLKIETNCKLAEELKNTAKDIYKMWFVQQKIPEAEHTNLKFSEKFNREIPDNWEECKISSIIKDFKKGDWGKEEKEGSHTVKVFCLRGTDMPIFREGVVDCLPSRFISTKHCNRLLEHGDFVVEISGTPGRSTYINKSMLERFENKLISSNFCQPFSFVNPMLVYWFYFLWDDMFQNGSISKFAGKTTISNLQFDILADSIYIVRPDDKSIALFYEKVSNIFEEIQTLFNENDELDKLKKRLLPLLITGQVKTEN